MLTGVLRSCSGYPQLTPLANYVRDSVLFNNTAAVNTASLAGGAIIYGESANAAHTVVFQELAACCLEPAPVSCSQHKQAGEAHVQNVWAADPLLHAQQCMSAWARGAVLPPPRCPCCLDGVVHLWTVCWGQFLCMFLSPSHVHCRPGWRAV